MNIIEKDTTQANMIIPIRCMTCGKVIADKYDYYVQEVSKLEGETTKPDNEPVGTKYFDKIKTGKILDSMGLTRYCCRRHMLGAVDMMDVI